MQLRDLEHFRDVLLERRQNLTEWLNSASLTQIGDKEKVRLLLMQIKDALERLESESYGRCHVCHDAIEMFRLEVQPTRQVCLDCLSDKEKAALEEDLFLATRIHRALLPNSVPSISGFEVQARSLAARNIGGDYYDFLPSPAGDTMRVIIADAMGQGLPAGLLMANLQGALRILSSDLNTPAPLIARLNQWLCRNVPVTKFISLACVSVDVSNKSETEIAYTNAGHCPPLLVRSDGTVEKLTSTGGVLGVHEEFAYEENRLTMHPGDFLMLYTDGIIEAQNSSGEFFEEDHLIDFIQRHRGDTFNTILDKLIKEVLDFTGTPDVTDDLTAIILLKK